MTRLFGNIFSYPGRLFGVTNEINVSVKTENTFAAYVTGI